MQFPSAVAPASPSQGLPKDGAMANSRGVPDDAMLPAGCGPEMVQPI